MRYIIKGLCTNDALSAARNSFRPNRDPPKSLLSLIFVNHTLRVSKPHLADSTANANSLISWLNL